MHIPNPLGRRRSRRATREEDKVWQQHIRLPCRMGGKTIFETTSTVRSRRRESQ
jgi:hypothetical protein